MDVAITGAASTVGRALLPAFEATDHDVTPLTHREREGIDSDLLELADDGGYDRIVLPGGRRSPLGKIQLGSTLEFVLLNAQTTVTLVR